MIFWPPCIRLTVNRSVLIDLRLDRIILNPVVSHGKVRRWHFTMILKSLMPSGPCSVDEEGGDTNGVGDGQVAGSHRGPKSNPNPMPVLN